VPYLFNDDKFETAANPGQRRLSAQMMRYWANFAHTGDPNGDGLPRWPPFDRGEAVPYVQLLAPDVISRVDYAAEHHLDFWSYLP
jgi:para-nitrobenzyl esterase